MSELTTNSHTKNNFFKIFLIIFLVTFIPALFFAGLVNGGNPEDIVTGIEIIGFYILVVPLLIAIVSCFFSSLILVFMLVMMNQMRKGLLINKRAYLVIYTMLTLDIISLLNGRLIPIVGSSDADNIWYPATGFWLWTGVVVYATSVYQIYSMEDEVRKKKLFRIISLTYLLIMILIAYLGYDDFVGFDYRAW